MKPTIVRSLGAAVLVLAGVGGLAGCQVQQVRPVTHHGPVYDDPWYDHDYFYYPGVQVYFHIHTGTYWYRDRGHWHRAHRLPPHIVILPRERVRIRVDRGEPWRHHHEHQQRYRPRFAPRDYQRPEWREHDRREREHNRQLYRDHRDHRDHREPRVNQAPPRRQDRQVRQVPRDQHLREPVPVRHEREVGPERQVRRERERLREQRLLQDDHGRQAREGRREIEAARDRRSHPEPRSAARQRLDEPQERRVREAFHDRRGRLASGRDEDTERRGTVDRRKRYSDGR